MQPTSAAVPAALALRPPSFHHAPAPSSSHQLPPNAAPLATANAATAAAVASHAAAAAALVALQQRKHRERGPRLALAARFLLSIPLGTQPPLPLPPPASNTIPSLAAGANASSGSAAVPATPVLGKHPLKQQQSGPGAEGAGAAATSPDGVPPAAAESIPAAATAADGSGTVMVRLRGERFRHITSRGARSSPAFVAALVGERVVDGRVVFASNRDYPSAVMSFLRYDPAARSAAVRRRHAAATRLLTDPVAEEDEEDDLRGGGLGGGGLGGGGGGPGGRRDGRRLSASGGPSSSATSFVRWRERSHARYLQPEFPPLSDAWAWPESAAAAAAVARRRRAMGEEEEGGEEEDELRGERGRGRGERDGRGRRDSSGEPDTEGGAGRRRATGRRRDGDGDGDGELLEGEGEGDHGRRAAGPGDMAGYDPLALDDPSLDAAARRVRYERDGYVMSVIGYKTAEAEEEETNTRFATAHPRLDFGDGLSLTLSKIRTLKKTALDTWWEKGWEITTVAIAIVCFERLVHRGLVNKGNRRLAMAVCLLLTWKMNEAREDGGAGGTSAAGAGGKEGTGGGTTFGGWGMSARGAAKGGGGGGGGGWSFSSSSSWSSAAAAGGVGQQQQQHNFFDALVDTPPPPFAPAASAKEVVVELEARFQVPRRAILAAEFPVFVHLGFALDVPPRLAAVHLDRLLAAKGHTQRSYLGVALQRRHALLSASGPEALRNLLRVMGGTVTREERSLLAAAGLIPPPVPQMVLLLVPGEGPAQQQQQQQGRREKDKDNAAARTRRDRR